MGNFFGTPENEYPQILDQPGIQKILKLLGDTKSDTLQNNPAPISDTEFNSDCPLSRHLGEISVEDPEFLNKALITISQHMNSALSATENRPPIYPDEEDNMTFRCGHLGKVKEGDSGYEDYQLSEFRKKFTDESDISEVFRGFCVYEFPDGEFKAICNTKRVDNENVYVGARNGVFMTYAPDENYELTNAFKITWWVYKMSDDSYRIFPGTGGGVALNDKNTIQVMDVSGLNSLVKWSETDDEKHLVKFETWSGKVLEDGMCWCICGGEREGELVGLLDFINRVDTQGEVFERDGNEPEREGDESEQDGDESEQEGNEPEQDKDETNTSDDKEEEN